MPKHSNDRLQGTLDLIVLRLLERRGPMNGYAIAQHVAQLSDNILRIQEGSLYPALHRMAQAGLLRSSWRPSDKGRRARYYDLTAAGRRQLAEETKRWNELIAAVAMVTRQA